MVTDEMVEAMMALVNATTDKAYKEVASQMANMLMAFDENEWNSMTDEERLEFLSRYVVI